MSLGRTRCDLSVVSDLKTVRMPCCCRQRRRDKRLTQLSFQTTMTNTFHNIFLNMIFGLFLFLFFFFAFPIAFQEIQYKGHQLSFVRQKIFFSLPPPPPPAPLPHMDSLKVFCSASSIFFPTFINGTTIAL